MDYKTKSILELRDDLINKRITTTELVKKVIRELKSELDSNTINYLAETQALKKAKEIDANFDTTNLLCGIPYLAKDNFSTKDIPTSCSSKILEGYVPGFSATVIERLDDSGAILLGKTALDELGMGGTGLSSCNGKIVNPRDKARLVGGSSSGSAYLVAKGIVPFATGSDTGDSIRKPASYNGIVGFKPTYGALSRYGLLPYAPSLDTCGYFTRNVDDMAVLCDASFGFDPKDFTSIEVNETNFYRQLNNFDNTKSFGYLTNVLNALDQEHKQKYLDLFEQLKTKGYTVKPIDFSQELLDAVSPVYMMISFSEGVSTNANLDGIKFGSRVEGKDYIEIMTKTRSQKFGPVVKRRFLIGSLNLKRENQIKYLIKAKKVRTLINQAIDKVFETVDVLLLPPARSVAPLIDKAEEVDENSSQNEFLDDILILSNFSGTPSITIPFFEIEKMPVGINITTKAKSDLLTLQAAKLLENIIGIKNQIVED
ncbi:amidase family protein [Mycoplasma putrefaciens]|uniref:Glutamyl-tRNA(Gln) amidotransferase subunit A n=1 Tax=Mycoplasma putrefaciens Mput9231 TaxID=1292033 RepID=M9W962_9MOLU|nr:amidase family protein [Mycoplasma putrefaciens]AGJ90553.1 Glutamyl-tRNA(Gln) amidotransferase subunit A [Mycoplasma putrefaciens Mput9231]